MQTIYCKKCKKFSIYPPYLEIDHKDKSSSIPREDEINSSSKHFKCKECESTSENDLSIIDEEIAQIIVLLNTKGYETEFSCAGHLEDNGKFYSVPYITFKSLHTAPRTAPGSWRYDNISKTDINNEYDVLALTDINSRSIYTIRKYKITKELRDSYLDTLRKWALDLPQLYTNKFESLYAERHKLDKNIDSKVIASKLFNELSDKLGDLYIAVTSGRTFSDFEDRKSISAQYNLRLKVEYKGYLQYVYSTISVTASFNPSNELLKENHVRFDIVAHNCAEEDTDFYNDIKLSFFTTQWSDPENVVYDNNISANVYNVVNFLMHNRFNNYDEYIYVLEENKDIYFEVAVSLTATDFNKISPALYSIKPVIPKMQVPVNQLAVDLELYINSKIEEIIKKYLEKK